MKDIKNTTEPISVTKLFYNKGYKEGSNNVLLKYGKIKINQFIEKREVLVNLLKHINEKEVKSMFLYKRYIKTDSISLVAFHKNINSLEKEGIIKTNIIVTNKSKEKIIKITELGIYINNMINEER